MPAVKHSTFILLVITFILTIISPSGYCSRILAVFPAPSNSHVILIKALLQELADRGHDVTLVSPFPEKKAYKNYRDITLDDLQEIFLDGETFLDLRNENALSHIKKYKISRNMSTITLENKQFQKVIQTEKFDLVIVETFLTDSMFALGHHFNCPVIAFCSFGVSFVTNKLVGNPSELAYAPNIFLGLTDHMTFFERTSNLICEIISRLSKEIFYIPQQQEIVEQYFPNAPPLNELIYNTSLVMVNSDFTIAYPRPIPPNMILIGGIHVKPPKKLPEDLQKYMDESKNGVILFSLGGNVKSSDFSLEKQKALLDAFSKIKQNVIWKWEKDSIPHGLPPNVKLAKWLPQQDILAHPNLLAFMTHGGQLSTIEAIDRGVPMIGIPIFGDQLGNMRMARNLGYGVTVTYDNISSDSIYWAINEVTSNQKYRVMAKKRSELYRAQSPKPLDNAVHWIEYVLKYDGAKHLRSAALDLHWFQYFMLDVILFLLTIILFTFGTIYYILKKLFSLLKKTKLTPNKRKSKTQ